VPEGGAVVAEALLRLQFESGTVDLVVPARHAALQLPALAEFAYDTWQQALPWTQATYQSWVDGFEDAVLPRLDEFATGWIEDLDHYYSAQFSINGALDVRWEDREQVPSKWRRATTRQGLAALAMAQIDAASTRYSALGDSFEARDQVAAWYSRHQAFLQHFSDLYSFGSAERSASLAEFTQEVGRVGATDPAWAEIVANAARRDWAPLGLDHPGALHGFGADGPSTRAPASQTFVLAETAPGSIDVVASEVLSGFGTHTIRQVAELDTAANSTPMVLARDGAAFDIVFQLSAAHEFGDADAALEHGWIEHNRLEGSRYVIDDGAADAADASAQMGARIAVLEGRGWSRVPEYGALGPLTVTGPQRLSAFAAAYTAEVMTSALSVFPRPDLERALANMVPTSSGELHREAGHLLVGHWVLANAIAERGVPEAAEARKRVERALLAVDPQVAIPYYRRMAVLDPTTAMTAAVWAALAPHGYSRPSMAEASFSRVLALADLAATDGAGLQELRQRRIEARPQSDGPLGAPELELATPYPAVYPVDWLVNAAAAGHTSYATAGSAPARVPAAESATTCWFDIATGTGAENWAGYASRHADGYWQAWLVVPEGHPLHGFSEPPRALAEATFIGTAAQAGLTGQSGDQPWLVGFACRTGHVTGALPPGIRRPEDLDLNAVRDRLAALAARIDRPNRAPAPVGVAAWPGRSWDRPPGPDPAVVTPAVAALARTRAPHPTATSRTGRSR
jgi:hypothetical protein